MNVIELNLSNRCYGQGRRKARYAEPEAARISDTTDFCAMSIKLSENCARTENRAVVACGHGH